MNSIEYVLITDPQIHSRIQARYWPDIETLTALGCRQLCYYNEQLKPYSAVFQFPMLLIMLVHREVITIQSPLRISAGFILLYHTDPPTIALPMGMGIKLYTDFTDRSIQITCTFSSLAVPRPSSLIHRIAMAQGIQEAWQGHQVQVRKLEGNGKVVHPQTSFNSYVDMSHREEETFPYFSAD